LGVTPLDAWIAKCDRIKRIDSTIDIDRAFLHKTTRKVSRDSVVSINGSYFEVPSILRSKTIEISYSPHPPLHKIEIRCDGKDFGEARLLDLYANTKIKRNGGQNDTPEEKSEGSKNKAGALL